MCRGNWNGAKTKSMLFFCTPKWVQKLDMTKAEKGVISGECLVWRRKNHTEGKAIT